MALFHIVWHITSFIDVACLAPVAERVERIMQQVHVIFFSAVTFQLGNQLLNVPIWVTLQNQRQHTRNMRRRHRRARVLGIGTVADCCDCRENVETRSEDVDGPAEA